MTVREGLALPARAKPISPSQANDAMVGMIPGGGFASGGISAAKPFASKLVQGARNVAGTVLPSASGALQSTVQSTRKAISGIARLEEIIEDRLDAEVAERVEQEARERGDEPIPWEVARRDLA